MLAILIARAKEDGKVGGLVPYLVEGGISILQYADDNILFLEHELAKAINMKLILAFFEQLSGLKINFHKNEVFFVSARLRIMRIVIGLFLVARLDLYHSSIWV
jgi:hypothetical protein